MPTLDRQDFSNKKGRYMSQQPTPIEVQKYLAGIDYPAGRDQLVSTAEDAGAPEDVLSALKGVPDREYSGPSAVSEALGRD